MLEKVLLVWNRNAKLLWSVGFHSGVSQKDEEEIFDKSEKIAKKKNFTILGFICLLLLTLSCQTSIENIRKVVIWSLYVLVTVVISIITFIAIYAIKVPV